MTKFFRLTIVMLLSMQCGFMKAADRIISEYEHRFDLALHHDPLLDHTSVCALSLVNKHHLSDSEVSQRTYYDLCCVYAYASDGDIKVIGSRKAIMSAGTGHGIRMGCCRGIPYLQMGYSDIGKIIDGPFIQLKDNIEIETIAWVYRGDPCAKQGKYQLYFIDGKESRNSMPNPEEYVESRRRPK